MPSYTGDPRHTELVAVLVPLLRRTCPADGGGYGGAYELRLGPEEAQGLGGVDLIRSAMRKAARTLGWSKLQTYGGAYPQVTVAGVVDQREIPDAFASAVEESRMARQHAAAEAVSRYMQDGKTHATRGSVYLTTQEFRAAHAAR